MSETTALVWFDRARQAIEQAARIDEVKTIRDQAEAMRLYCKQQREGLQMQNRCAEIKIRAERRAGELLAEIPREQGKRTDATSSDHQTKLATIIREQGIKNDQAYRWQTMAALPAEKFAAHLATVGTQAGELTSSSVYEAAKAYLDPAHVAHNSGEQEWDTPPAYLEAARQVLGTIDLDPASTARANERVQATRYYTAADNGLLHPWTGRVWLNPPYATKLVWRFTHKLCGHLVAGDVTAAIVLVNNATETRWYQELDPHCPVVCFPRRRIRFLTPEGVTGGPLQGQAVFYAGPHPESFADVFKAFGRLRWL